MLGRLIPALLHHLSHKLMTVTPEELLNSTAVGCGWHDFGVEGGVIRVSTDELRPVLEQAYDPSMPDWPGLISWDDEDGFFVA